MTPHDEAQFLSQALEGDRAALGELLAAYQHRLFNVVLRMVNHREDAAEVTQEAMLKIVQHIDGYNGKAKLSTWMIRIAMNQSISHLRKRKVRQTGSLDAQYTAGDAAGGDHAGAPLRDRLEEKREPGPEQCVQEREMIEHLHLAMSRLDEDFRAVLVLRDIDGMDYQEIAQSLDVPVGTVKSRLFRARVALREQMHEIYPSTEMESRRAAAAKPRIAAKATPLAEGVSDG